MFKTKKIHSPARIGQQLKTYREKHELSIEQMAGHLKLSKKYVEALEDCRFHDIPFAPIYQKNMIRKYIEVLRLDPQGFLQQFAQDELTAKPQPVITPTHLKKSFHINLPIVFRFGAVALLILALSSYLGIQINNIVKPPELAIFTPNTDLTTSDSSVAIKGKTERSAQVLINGKQIRNDDQGFFETELNLNEGVNTITITAEKKHSKNSQFVRHIVYQKS